MYIETFLEINMERNEIEFNFDLSVMWFLFNN